MKLDEQEVEAGRLKEEEDEEEEGRWKKAADYSADLKMKLEVIFVTIFCCVLPWLQMWRGVSVRLNLKVLFSI